MAASASIGKPKRTRRPNGTLDFIIEWHIANGLHLKNDGLYLGSGEKCRIRTEKHRYNRVCLSGPKKEYGNFTVGRIVCWLIYGPPPTSRHEADHINRIKNDDRPENLRWVTHSENQTNIGSQAKRDRIRRLRRLGQLGLHRGEHHSLSRLTEKIIADIRQDKKRGLSSLEIATKYQIARSHANSIIRGAAWKHVPM